MVFRFININQVKYSIFIQRELNISIPIEKVYTSYTSPTHPFYEKYKLLVEHHLDFIIETQQSDGSWTPDWSWGETEYWEIVRKKLQGVITLRNISVLKNFGRIECI